ncbi:hypothetical protein LZ30DRAFT_694329 [Colletotrichum cereale]|nr:hypothetical protein LZ30DRAFT_694329 [Colletotrichum cereale]
MDAETDGGAFVALGLCASAGFDGFGWFRLYQDFTAVPNLKGTPASLPTPPSALDLTSLPQTLKDLVNEAIRADRDALLQIWVDLSRAMAFIGPSVQIFNFPIAHTLATLARAAESVVWISDDKKQ